MQSSKMQDTLVGLFVASGIATLFYMAMQISNLGFAQDETYTMTANFDNSGGLKVKSAVSLAGVAIGRVSKISIDTENYESIVEIQIESQYQLPDDTTASIFTAGLLGEQYIHLEPGGSEEYITENGAIDITQSAIVLEDVIGQFLIKMAEK
jgi:phospholipid/cholesterol/gamma-HCH transport system substrate-binding protein